ENAPNIVIGGRGPLDGNVISASGQDGIFSASSNPVSVGQGISIYGNYIGTDATGLNAIPNTQSGIRLWTPYAVVGDIGAGNVISGNHGSGISIDGTQGSHHNSIGANLIGVTSDATKKLGNLVHGIEIHESNNNFVGGNTGDGSGNLIGGNGNEGIAIDGANATNNVVEGNAI